MFPDCLHLLFFISFALPYSNFMEHIIEIEHLIENIWK